MSKKHVLVTVLLISVMILTVSCGVKPVQQDTSPLTMYIGLGNTNSTYYQKIRDLVLEKTGIELQFVYSNNLDTTGAMKSMLANNDLPADIIATARSYRYEDVKDSLIDLASYTNIPDKFSPTVIKNFSTDGKVFQIPYTTRLIGIQYNRTLFEEMGWNVPSDFDEMVSLKEKAEQAGYPFAYAGGVATGHGFNYLFYVLGTNWLTTPDGAQWMSDFISGNTDVSGLEQNSAYFEKYVEAGLFGTLHTSDWIPSTKVKRERALFYYNILNDCYSYDGFRYNADGTLYGAEYSGSDPVAVEDANGNAVLVNGSYVLYDESNKDHAGLVRYTIPGTQELHDRYASMPWISENGSCNCFATYDSMYLSLNAKLLQENQKNRLAEAIKVLEFMTTDEACRVFTDMFRDGYVASSTFTIDDSRLYADSADQISKGYLMPWYYNNFQDSVIVPVGQKVNDFILGKSDIKSVFNELQTYETVYLDDEPEVAAVIKETFDYKDNAGLCALSCAMAVQSSLDNAGVNSEVNVVLMPYITTVADINTNINLSPVQQKIYKGNLLTTEFKTLISSGSDKSVAVRMTGSEINGLLKSGLNTAEYGYDHVFSYECLTKGNFIIDDSITYIVALPVKAVPASVYKAYTEEGKVVSDADGKIITANIEKGMTMFFEGKTELGISDISWN